MGNSIEREVGAWQGRRLLERFQILTKCVKEFGLQSVHSEEEIVHMFYPQSSVITFLLMILSSLHIKASIAGLLKKESAGQHQAAVTRTW